MQQAEALHLLSALFNRLLSVDNGPGLTHHISLETFASFAELTAHESAVADSIGSDDHTRQSVVDFLSRVSDSFSVHCETFCIQFSAMLTGLLQTFVRQTVGHF